MRTRTRPHFREHIMADPKILGGKPVIKGTRIPVELILAKLAENPDLAELLADYPRLTEDDVKAVLAYAQEAVARMEDSALLALPFAGQAGE